MSVEDPRKKSLALSVERSELLITQTKEDSVRLEVPAGKRLL